MYIHMQTAKMCGLILVKEVLRGSVKRVGKDHRDRATNNTSKPRGFFPFFLFFSFLRYVILA